MNEAAQLALLQEIKRYYGALPFPLLRRSAERRYFYENPLPIPTRTPSSCTESTSSACDPEANRRSWFRALVVCHVGHR